MKVKIQLLLPVLFLAACSSHNPKSHQSAQRKTEDTVDYAQIKEKGVLRAVTLYSPTSYFLYRMEPMGFEYELIHDFAEGEGLELEVRAARDQAQMLEMLRSGEADVAAYPVVFNKELMAGFTYCGHEEQSSQVLVQAPSSGQAPVNDVTGLIGRDVYVQAGSPYHERLLNLDRELGGGIRIHALSDSLDTKENLIAQVAKGKIPFTVADD
ncbi:MAG: transporter substrate-binding domain-containing protein, partial [Tannerella sp.]|nr:transporter substrate-binding domain-containing protein [Tannerella sp.]